MASKKLLGYSIRYAPGGDLVTDLGGKAPAVLPLGFMRDCLEEVRQEGYPNAVLEPVYAAEKGAT